MINASDLAELMGISRAASWQVIELLERHEAQFMSETGHATVPRTRETIGTWHIEERAANRFAQWWKGMIIAQGMAPRFVLLAHQAYNSLQTELEELGAPDALKIVGLTDPFFKRIGP